MPVVVDVYGEVRNILVSGLDGVGDVVFCGDAFLLGKHGQLRHFVEVGGGQETEIILEPSLPFGPDPGMVSVWVVNANDKVWHGVAMTKDGRVMRWNDLINKLGSAFQDADEARKVRFVLPM